MNFKVEKIFSFEINPYIYAKCQEPEESYAYQGS